MAIELTAGEQLLMEASSYGDAPKESQYGDYESLFYSMTSLGAAKLRNDINEQTRDLTPLNDISFNRENLRTYLDNNKVDPVIASKVMESHLTNWDKALARIDYLKALQESSSNVAENFSTAGMIAAGLPMALIDLPANLVGGGAVGVAAKGLSFAAKVAGKEAALANTHRAAKFAAGGAVFATADMATYETITGDFQENSLIHSALLGAALGGTLGFMLEKTATLPSKTDLLDGNNQPITKEQATVNEIDAAHDVVAKIDEVVAEFKATQTDLTKQTKEAVTRDIGRARFDATKPLLDAAASAKTNLDNLSAAFKAADKESTTLTKQRSAATKAIDEIAPKALERDAVALSLKDLTKPLATLKGQLTKANNALAKLDKEAPDFATKEKEIKTKISALTKDIKKQESQKKRTEAKLNKLDTVLKDLTFKSSEAERRRINSDLTKANKRLIEARKARDKALEAHKAAVAAYKKGKKEFDSSLVKDSWETKTLKEKMTSLGATMTPEGLNKLLKERDIHLEDLAKLEADNFDGIKYLRKIKKTQQNKIIQLQKELDDIFAPSKPDLSIPEGFKKAHPLISKLVISPIENLLRSPREKVVGLSLLLHSGTLHHGLVNNRTAWTVRTELDKQLDRVHKALIYNYRQALKDGSFTGKFAGFEDAVGNAIYKTTGKIQKELYTGIDGAIVGEARAAIAKQRESGVTREKFSDNEWMNKSVDDFLDYYENMFAFGNKVGMESLKEVIGKGYVNRVYSSKKIMEMGEAAAVKHLVDAQKAFAIATNSKLDGAVIKSFEEKAKTVVKATLDKEARYKQVVDDLGLPHQSNVSQLKVRTIDAFDDDLAALLDNNITGVSSLYGLKMHGRLALKEKLGVDTDAQLRAMIEEAVDGNVKDRENLTVVIDTILGTREMVRNPYHPFTRIVRGASTYSSLVHTLAFAVPTITELSAISSQFGWGRTMNHFFKSPKEILNIYRNGTAADRNHIEMMISYSDAYLARRTSRIDVENNVIGISKVEEFLQDTIHKEAVFGGLLPITDMLRMTTASLAVDFMARMSVAAKISKTDMMRLNDMGISAEDLPIIRQTLNVDSTGRILNTDRKTWGALDEKITLGVMNMTERTILHPNGITLPKFMTDMNTGQFLPMVMFKFMRFPFESYERLLGRGLQEADAKQVLALTGNIAMWSGILAMKDALKDEEDRKYSGEDGMATLAKDAFLYNSVTSLPVSALDIASGLTTGKTYFGDYRYSVMGAVGSDVNKLISGQATYSIPFYNLKVGEAVNNALAEMQLLEEVEYE